MSVCVCACVCMCVRACSCVCVCVCVCVRAYVTEVGCSRGGTRLVMHNLHTCTLYCVCVDHKRTQSGRGS